MDPIEPIVEPVGDAETVARPESAPAAEPLPRLTVAVTFDSDAISDSVLTRAKAIARD